MPPSPIGAIRVPLPRAPRAPFMLSPLFCMRFDSDRFCCFKPNPQQSFAALSPWGDMSGPEGAPGPEAAWWGPGSEAPGGGAGVSESVFTPFPSCLARLRGAGWRAGWVRCARVPRRPAPAGARPVRQRVAPSPVLEAPGAKPFSALAVVPASEGGLLISALTSSRRLVHRGGGLSRGGRAPGSGGEATEGRPASRSHRLRSPAAPGGAEDGRVREPVPGPGKEALRPAFSR